MPFLKSHVAQSHTNDCMSVYADFLWGSKIVWHKFWSCTYCRWFRKSLLRSGSAVEAEKFCVEKMEKRRKCHQAYNTKTCWRSCRMSGDLNDINHAHKYWLSRWRWKRLIVMHSCTLRVYVQSTSVLTGPEYYKMCVFSEQLWCSRVSEPVTSLKQGIMLYSRHRLTASMTLWLYVHVRVNQWPLGSPYLPIGQFVKN